MPEPTHAWYYVGGLGVIGWAFIAVAAGIAVHQKAQSWWTWGCGLIGTLFLLGAGQYLAQINQVQDLAGVLSRFKIVAFVIFIAVLVMAVKLLVGAIPDQYAAEITLTMGLALGAMCLPVLAQFVPGEAGRAVQQGTASVAQPVVEGTAGWFG